MSAEGGEKSAQRDRIELIDWHSMGGNAAEAIALSEGPERDGVHRYYWGGMHERSAAVRPTLTPIRIDTFRASCLFFYARTLNLYFFATYLGRCGSSTYILTDPGGYKPTDDFPNCREISTHGLTLFRGCRHSCWIRACVHERGAFLGP